MTTEIVYPAPVFHYAEEAHQQFPLSRGIARQYADALIVNGKLDEAGRFLREQVLPWFDALHCPQG